MEDRRNAGDACSRITPAFWSALAGELNEARAISDRSVSARPPGLGDIVVSSDEYFVLGDNQPASDDSRFWGPVNRSWLIGLVKVGS